MMRFLLDCLRPGRQRASCGRENSVEIPTREKEAANDNEIKDLEDVVAMEEGALQREGAVCRDTQQSLETLAKRRHQLKEEIERIQEECKRQGQLLLSLQEEQEESEQMVREYDAELTKAKQELQRLQEDIESTRARVEDAHGRMGPLKHSISETYEEITEAKQRLGELITEMIAIEACASEVTCHQTLEPLSLSLDSSSREEEDDAEEGCAHVSVNKNPPRKDREEMEPSEPEQIEESFEKLQRSAENLKSSGSSSFTEITLTEFKEEDASPRSITPQNTGSADLDEEEFEIVNSLMIKPVSQTINREFDFFHPDPFVDHDVFGDDRFPKVDMTEFLTGDPFKGTDPFASDLLFTDAPNSPLPQNSPLSMMESNPFPSRIVEPPSKEERGDESDVARASGGPICSQSIDSGMFEQNIPEFTVSERALPSNDMIETNHITGQDLENTLRTKSDVATSPQIEDRGRFDPILCEDDGIRESESSNASTVDSSFDGDFCTVTGTEDKPEAEVRPSSVRHNQALYGLQRIDTSLYTSFPLSPEAYDPEPEPEFNETTDKEMVADPLPITSDHNTVSEPNPDLEDLSPHNESGNPTLLSEDLSPVRCDPCSPDPNRSNPTNDGSHSGEPSDSDAYDHKFGDIYFFTVRLDPGSSDASPVSPESSDRKKSECDQASLESSGTDGFDGDGTSPDNEDPKQESVVPHAEEGFVQETETPCPKPADQEPKASYDGLDFFEDNFVPGSNTTFGNASEMTENADPTYMVDTISVQSNSTEPVNQYLISPVSDNTGMFVPDSRKLCARNPFSFDSASIDRCDSAETYVIKQSDVCDTELEGSVLLHPAPIHNRVCTFEVKNAVHSESRRLDSGYHEFTGLDLSSPACPASTDLVPDCANHKLEILSPDDLIMQAPDPFSPESNDAMFDSKICNPATSEEVAKDSHDVQDLFGGSFSGSELESFDPFSPMPSFTGGQSCPGSAPSDTRFYEETRSSSWDSGVSQSPLLHSDFASNKEDNHADSNLVNTDAENISYSSSYSTTDSFFESDSSTLTDLGSLKSKVDPITTPEKNSGVNVTAMEDLAEIDFFCSELSKMVASRSSDAVQQSVTEMLFGSNPDTTKFYPWDLENSNVVVDKSSPEGDFGNTESPSLL